MADGGQHDVGAWLERLILHDHLGLRRGLGCVIGPLGQALHQVIQPLPVIRLEWIVKAILGGPVDHDLGFHVGRDVRGPLGQIDCLPAQLGVGIAELAELPAWVHPQVRAELHDDHAQVIGQLFQVLVCGVGDLGWIVHLQPAHAVDRGRQLEALLHAQVGAIALLDEPVARRSEVPHAGRNL